MYSVLALRSLLIVALTAPPPESDGSQGKAGETETVQSQAHHLTQVPTSTPVEHRVSCSSSTFSFKIANRLKVVSCKIFLGVEGLPPFLTGTKPSSGASVLGVFVTWA